MRKLVILSLLFIPLLLQAETPKLPKDKELKTLVFDSLFAFNKAVQAKNFAQFHQERLSPEFQKQVPLDKFTAAFQVFIDKGYDISNIAKSEPVFDTPPAIDRWPSRPERSLSDPTEQGHLRPHLYLRIVGLETSGPQCEGHTVRGEHGQGADR